MFNLFILLTFPDQVLTVRLQQNNNQDWDDLFNRVSVFLTECNGEQIRHSPNNFADLCHIFTDRLVSGKKLDFS